MEEDEPLPLYINYRHLNSITKVDTYPLPRDQWPWSTWQSKMFLNTWPGVRLLANPSAPTVKVIHELVKGWITLASCIAFSCRVTSWQTAKGGWWFGFDLRHQFKLHQVIQYFSSWSKIVWGSLIHWLASKYLAVNTDFQIVCNYRCRISQSILEKCARMDLCILLGILVADHQNTEAVAVTGMAVSDISSTGKVVAFG